MRHAALALLFPFLLLSCASEPATDDLAAPDTAAVGDAAPEAVTPDPQRFVGLVHPPLPDSLEKRGGALATAPDEEAADARYAFEDVLAGELRYLWLSELQGRDAGGEATWRVVDAVVLPEVREGETFLIHGCRTADRTGVAAVARQAETETLTDVRLAWGVDRAAGRLTEVDPAGVTCENEGLRAP